MVFRFLVLLVTLSACTNVKHVGFNEESLDERTYKVELSSVTHIPYCGGAYPTQEQARGYDIPSEIQLYYLTTDSVFTTESTYQTIEISEGGIFQFRLDPGTYFVQHPDKKLSIGEFMNKNRSQNSNQIMHDSDCYLKWKNTPDLKLTVTSDTTVQITYRATCFTGTNPCIGYNGPYPP